MSSPKIKNVIIVGAGGNLGPTILNTFLAESAFNVTVLSRQESKSTFPSGVKVVKADYNSADSLASAFQGQDAVISLIGGAALGDQNKLIDGAVKAGVKRFIPSEFGSNTRDPRVFAIVPFFSAKTSTVDHLKSKEKEMSWTSFITGPFIDWGIKAGFLHFDLSCTTVTLIDDGKGIFTGSNLRQIGRALIKSLEESSKTKNTYVMVGSFTTSQAEILAEIEKVSGQKWTVKNTTTKELITEGSELIKKNDFVGGVTALIRAAALGGASLGDSRNVGLWNEKLGLKEESLEDTVKAVLAGKLVGEK